MFGLWKKQPQPEYIQNTKPENATYDIVLGEDLKVGDIIIHNYQRCVITSLSNGKGAGSLDFGEYISVVANKLTGQVGHLTLKFWVFEDCPVIVEKANV